MVVRRPEAAGVPHNAFVASPSRLRLCKFPYHHALSSLALPANRLVGRAIPESG